MSEDHFPRSQRELVSLALQRGCRRAAAPSGPDSQRDRVRQALALGVGGSGAKQRGPSSGIRR
ncbi:MAG: hypothetical protein QOD81_225 [Solirubrobacteraceae bacterium]|nr:hypothetical protein [Solirubrobacteraceae bacterium]